METRRTMHAFVGRLGGGHCTSVGIYTRCIPLYLYMTERYVESYGFYRIYNVKGRASGEPIPLHLTSYNGSLCMAYFRIERCWAVRTFCKHTSVWYSNFHICI